jgi:hypothetical protein
MTSSLETALLSGGEQTRTLVSSDGARFLFLSYGGRLLGMWPRNSGRNLLWTNDALSTPESASAFFRSRDWNAGGDRIWLSPEVDIFAVPGSANSAFRVPPELDPGSYSFEYDGESGFVRVGGEFSLQLARSGEKARVTLTKKWQPISDPCPRQGIAYTGYVQRTELQVRPETARLSIWSIAQFPYGGTVLIPTTGRTEPVTYTGAITDDELGLESNLIRYRPRQPGVHKFGVIPRACAGVIAYSWREGDESTLIVRRFQVCPHLGYGDVAWFRSKCVGGKATAAQVCSVSGELGQYVELEYHAPLSARVDVSHLYAWRGPHDEVAQLSERVLGGGSV